VIEQLNSCNRIQFPVLRMRVMLILGCQGERGSRPAKPCGGMASGNQGVCAIHQQPPAKTA